MKDKKNGKPVNTLNGDLRDAVAAELSAHKDTIVKEIVEMLTAAGDWAAAPLDEKLKNKKEAIRLIEVFTRGRTLEFGDDDTGNAGDGQGAITDATVSSILGDIAEIEESNESGRVKVRP